MKTTTALTPELIRTEDFTPYEDHGPRFRLELFDVGKTDKTGKFAVGYRLRQIDAPWEGETIIFDSLAGETDTYVYVRCPIDSDRAVESVMGFLTLRRGDADADWFDGYTEAEMSFAEVHAEAVAHEVHQRFGEHARLREVPANADASALLARDEDDVHEASLLRLDLAREGITGADVVARLLAPVLGPVRQEVMVTLVLSARNRLTGAFIVSVGTLTSALAHPREVFREAIKQSAAQVILVHSHPSGDSSPSSEDDALTERIAAAGELLGIPLLDHVIIGDGEHYSYAEAGRLTA